jgi:hypothetical protein
MKILNPNNLPTIDYRKVKPLQGNLKDLETDNHDKMLSRLEKRGFIVPLFLWHHDDELYLLDGHQRQRVMELNELHDNGNYEVPYILIDAPNEKTAKEILLEITSQYGTITPDGLDEFTAMAELEAGDLSVNFDAINLDKLWAEMDEAEEKAEKTTTKNKLPCWTLDQLHREAGEFTEARNTTDLAAFLDWLGENGNV